MENGKGQELGFLDLLIMILSIYVLGAIVVDTFVPIRPEVSHMLHVIDTMVCVVFLFEFLYRFFNAESKIKFMRWGWIDLLASIPNVDFLRIGRVARLFRLFRIVRAFRSTHYLVSYIFRDRIKGAFSSVVILSVLVIMFSSIGVLSFETAPNSNIKTAGDALWWAFTTVTTVGYGDLYPVTTEGRIIAVVLMVTGVGLFGTFTGFVTSWFMDERREKSEERKGEL
ncbi:ion transporter [Williamwhitmania taraxaci]|uniref:Voltage-gated potassium channel n=1 Tax=Williamwhitmania taraxaci TaxID=1640674 RepID=A0A1G6QUA4_9BACT|nr:ion transporter [Williamwhitmania taraxaci]SDC95247.1 voltage-gated potassium channel [Williamwhitmania taraxaci]